MGSNRNGRLGHSETHGFVKFPGSESSIRLVAAGCDFTIAVGQNGENLYGWGLGIYGRSRGIYVYITKCQFNCHEGLKQSTVCSCVTMRVVEIVLVLVHCCR